MRPNELTHEIIGAAIEVHRELGPGKPEAAYEAALAHELALRGLATRAQKPVPVVYKGVKLECGYRIDLLVGGIVVVEVKSVEAVAPVHRAQVLTYLKLGGWNVALLLNFNVATLKEGIERFVLGSEEEGGKAAAPQGTPQTADTALTAKPGGSLTLKSGDDEAERLSNQILGAAFDVHRELGPGLLPSAYEECLCHELSLRGVPFERQRRLALTYKGAALTQADEIALLVGGRVVINPCALPQLQPVHEAQLLSQLRLGGWPLGLMINFNTVLLTEGIRRLVFSRRRG